MKTSEIWRGASGIYEIENTLTGARYYGSARCLGRRQMEHFTALRVGRHENARLQNAWNKYGGDVFEFRVLAVLERSEVLSTEQRLISQRYGKQCYNIRREVSLGMTGKSMPESAKVKLSSDRRGRVFTPEHRAKISAAKKGKPGRTQSPESRARISATKRGVAFSAEHREALAAAHRGKPLSAEHRAAVLAGQKDLRKSPEHRAKQSAGRMAFIERQKTA